MDREGADPGADRDRQAFGGPELQAEVREARSDERDRRFQVGRQVRRDDDEELVGPVAPPLGLRRKHVAQERGDHRERLIARGMAVRLVEVPEVVDVEQRDPEGLAAVARRLDRDGEYADQGPVIERAGHLIQARRLEQFVGLAQDAPLGGPEHEVQRDRGHRPGEHRDDHDLPTKPVEVTQDGCRVSPDTDDRDDRAVDLDREVRPQDVVRGQGRPDGLGIGDRVEPGGDRPAGGGDEVRRRRSPRAERVTGVREQDRAVR